MSSIEHFIKTIKDTIIQSNVLEKYNDDNLSAFTVTFNGSIVISIDKDNNAYKYLNPMYSEIDEE